MSKSNSLPIYNRSNTMVDRQTAEADIKAILDRCVVGACVTDDKANFVYVNDSYCRIYGYERHELIGKHFTIVAPDPDRFEVWQEIYDAFMREGYEIAGDWVVKHRDGRLLTIRTDAARIGSEESGYLKVTYVMDLTEKFEPAGT